MINTCSYDTTQLDKKILEILDRAAEQDSLFLFRQTLQTCCGDELAPEVKQQTEDNSAADHVNSTVSELQSL